MESPQTLDIHGQVKDVVKIRHMATIPEWSHIPEIMGFAHETLKFRRAPLDDVLAVLEAVYLSLRGKVNSHMYGWESEKIIKFGTLLASCETYLEMAGDELIRYDNEDNSIGNMWPVFDLIKEVWNEMFALGYMEH